ncbi:lysoplasmalogenase [Qipengyuania vesicularis]|uniref:lysoplasmalogenase n=1 Tax=Qipengyuania vesicularis TaxID=2867232 RepID=UPI001C88B9CC|nr:lysoplasmalogenase [Qipengyuania vesicularis]MBX7526838.1 lysoplasmalogenase [Qipengyuania vesicularis]
MPKRALIEHRPYLLLSLLFAITYFFVMDGKVGGSWLALWKGAGVGFLAVYAAHRGMGREGALIASVMTLGALADVVIEFNFLAGGALFGVAHLIAIWLFLSNRRERPTGSQNAAGVALLIGTPLLAALLTYPLENWYLAALYALILGIMAGSAWTSSFPRYRVGVGAVLFVVSDLAIFAREAERIPLELAEWLVWPLYYSAQFLIVTGVIQTIRKGKD